MNIKKPSPLAGALKLSLSTLVVAATVGLPIAAQAQTATMNVTARVNSQCQFQTVNDMAFGAVDLTTGKTADVGIRIQCNKGATVNLAANNTSLAGDTGDSLNYTLGVTTAVGAACTTASALGTSAVGLNALWASSGGPRDLRMCGAITAGQDVLPGNYSQAVTLTITNN
ncbi:spore coat U domain-containing protein [Burkholderiaceae bacterium FT117]|uniref:spore coat protein U domain-containing protein n=1 Tax=Zeimonas sediminis TaxID=2944268 RepID=UPI002342E5C4|nr:spore coat protein U domain-containing protein [Zeimonas sediminis]MCM5569961.1 spore coat U domain-containing protein [Zeimonas sediminis]